MCVCLAAILMQCRCGTFLYSSIDKDWMKVEILADSLKALKGKTLFRSPSLRNRVRLRNMDTWIPKCSLQIPRMLLREILYNY